ncbi:hypothetical protein BDN67DRAFT_976753 [Paxillus ammoniavirescens]|nr:hypothetical protein BDN67DRAFT_976753 [Paxillus ammoniavirescens]
MVVWRRLRLEGVNLKESLRPGFQGDCQLQVEHLESPLYVRLVSGHVFCPERAQQAVISGDVGQ